LIWISEGGQRGTRYARPRRPLRILQENKGKAGVYRLVNLVNKKTYIGSSVNLERRMREYFSIPFLETQIKTNKSQIYRSLLKAPFFYNNNNNNIIIK
jgi:excinuclease UvrABC nuclease subunit